MTPRLPLTKYHQIYLVLREQLLEGRFAKSMPAEMELAKQFSVGRVTIRHAMEKLQRLWELAPGPQASLACLMIDAYDFIARLGGDEFCVFCQATGMAGAEVLAAHLLEVVSRLKIEIGDGR